MYRLQAPDESQSGEWRSKISVPYAFTNVEDVVPHLMEGTWGNERPFKLVSEQDEELIEAWEKLMYHQATELMDLEEDWEEYQKQKAIYGTTAAFVGFKMKYRNKRMWAYEESGLTGETYPRIQSVRTPEYIGPTFEVIDIYDLYPHPRATSKNIRELFWRQFRTKEWLEAAAPRFKNLGMLKPEHGTSTPNFDSGTAERSSFTGSANNESPPPGENNYEVVTYFDDINKKIVSFIPQANLIIEEGDYPYFHDELPIVFDFYTKLPKEFWAMGLIEPALPLIHEGNTIRNQRRDNVNLIVNAMMEIRDGEIDDEEDELWFRPGGVFHSRSGEAARFLQPPMVTQDSHMEESKVQADIARVTGTSGPLSGQSDPRVSSASGTSLLQKAQLLRLSRAIKSESRAFKKVIRQMVALNDQFMPVPEVFTVLGPKFFSKWERMGPQSCALKAQICVQPAGLYVDEALLRQHVINAINVIGANPVMAAKVDWVYILKKVLKLHGFEDVDRAMGKAPAVNIMENMFAMQENNELATKGQLPPAGPEDDYDIHVEVHEMLLRLRPDLWQQIGEHLATHEQAKLMQQQMVAPPEQQLLEGDGARLGDNGPGSKPAGARGGVGVNPNRQPKAADDRGMSATKSRMAPRA